MFIKISLSIIIFIIVIFIITISFIANTRQQKTLSSKVLPIRVSSSPLTAPPKVSPTTAPPKVSPTMAPPKVSPTMAPPKVSPTMAPPKAFYILKINMDNYDPRIVFGSVNDYFQSVNGCSGRTIWDGNSTIDRYMCFTEDQTTSIYNDMLDFATKKFITSASSQTFRFWVDDSIEVVNYHGSLLTPSKSGTPYDGTPFYGGFIRVADGCCNMLHQDRIITSDDRIMYFNDDNMGHPFSALSISDFYPPIDHILQFNSNKGRCDNSNNFCDPNKGYAIAKCSGDDYNNVAWTFEFVVPQVNVVEELCNKNFLYEGRLFKLKKSNCDYVGWYINYGSGGNDVPYDIGTATFSTHSGLRPLSNRLGASSLSFRADQS